MNSRIKRMLTERILTTRELAERLNVPETTIQKRVARGKIEAVIKGNTYLFDVNDFQDPE